MGAEPAPAGTGPVARSLGPAFWRIWWASTAANLGDGVRLVALPLLALTLTRDPLLVSLVVAAGSLPWLVVGLFAGVLVDRWDRVRILWVVNAVRAATMAVLVVATATGWVSIWLLVGVALVIGTGETLVDNAAQAVLPRVVPQESLDRANGRLHAGQVVTGQFLGQGLGGVLFGVAAVLPLVLDATALAFAALVTLSLAAASPATARPQTDPAGPGSAGPARMLQDVGEGLRWLLTHRLLRALWVMIAALGLASGAFWGIIALYAVQVLGLSPSGYGLVLAVGAAGSLVGSLTAGAVRSRLGTTRSIHLAVALITAACVGLAVTRSGYTAAAVMVVNGVGVLIWNVVGVSLRQRVTPTHLIGRVNAAFSFVAVGATSLGALTAGLVARQVSLPAVFWLSALLVALTWAATAPALRTGRQQAPHHPRA